MAEPSKHELTIKLPYCWVCGRYFIETGGDAQCEHHHVVPKAAGGVDGPTVSICTDHHSLLHNIATAMSSGRSWFKLLQHEQDLDRKRKILYLAETVHNSFKAIENDPNRRVLCTISLDVQHAQMIDFIKKIRGSKSREQVILLAIELLYRQVHG